MEEEKKLEDKEFDFFYVSITLNTGDTVICLAAIPNQLEKDLIDVEWIKHDFLLVSYPIKVSVEFNVVNSSSMILFSKYNNFNVLSLFYLHTKNIVHVNFIDEDLISFYKEAKEFLQKNYDPILKKEVTNYSKMLKQKNSLTDNQRKQSNIEFIKLMLSNTSPTVH